MRRPDEQVKRAILSPDPDVRSAAITYFQGSSSTDGEILTLAIRAIEQYGWDTAFSYYGFMKALPHTRETVGWLIAEIRQHGQTDEPDGYVSAIGSALASTDVTVLEQCQSEIFELEALEDETKKAISERMELRSRSADELWSALEDVCRQCDKEYEIPDANVVGPLVDALGCHPEFSAAKAPAVLDASPSEDWIEIYCIRLAGKLRLRESIPRLIGLLNNSDEWAHHESYRALSSMGGDDLVEELARAFAAGNDELRMSVANVLQHIHSDSSVDACLRLFESEQSHVVKCFLLQGALDSFVTESIEPARQYILATPRDPELLGVRRDLLVACKVMGESFPEFDEWTEDLANDADFRRQWYAAMAGRVDSDDVEEDDEDEDEYYGFDEPLPPEGTIVRDEMRVGRNDPCPCGSGKKFKKCCLAKRGVAQ